MSVPAIGWGAYHIIQYHIIIPILGGWNIMIILKYANAPPGPLSIISIGRDHKITSRDHAGAWSIDACQLVTARATARRADTADRCQVSARSQLYRTMFDVLYPRDACRAPFTDHSSHSRPRPPPPTRAAPISVQSGGGGGVCGRATDRLRSTATLDRLRTHTIGPLQL